MDVAEKTIAVRHEDAPSARDDCCPPDDKPAALTIAYLVNQYPKVSHSFIRREIAALESQGVSVLRFAVRGWDLDVSDPADELERKRTRYLLHKGMWPLLRAATSCALANPRGFLDAVSATVKLALNADRAAPYHLNYLLQACQLALWLDEAGAEHIHAHFGTNPAEVALLVHLLSGKTYSFTVHGSEEFDKALYLHLDAKIEHAKFVVAVNSYCRSQLMRRVKQRQWSKIKVVHCGLGAEIFQSEARPISADNQRFVCVGRFCEQKAHLLLLEAFARVLQKFPGCRLVLAGDGEMRPEVEDMIERLDVREQVTITGWISEAQVVEEIAASRALVLASFAESLPVVIMEAMALRKPVISTQVAGIPELVADGDTGWLVPAGSVDSLVQAMLSCLRASPETLGRMGEAAHARVSRRHRGSHEALRLVSLFRSSGRDDELTEWTA